MLPNKFDQYFRDKLLDHPTKVSPNTWKLIHAGLLRHKAFHFWKWYVAGPSVIVVVALTGHLILAQINKPVKSHNDAATHTLTQPVTAPAQTAAASEATTPASTTRATASTPKTNSSSVTDGTAHKPHTTSGTSPFITPAAAARGMSNVNTSLSTKTSPPTRSHTRHGPASPSETGLLASHAPTTKDPGRPQNRSSGSHTSAPANLVTSPTNLATQSADLTTQPARRLAPPAGPTTQPAIVRPATRLAITAQTPNPRSPKNLVIPATPYYHTSKWRIDGYASPEYFSFKEFGFSYGAGARATFVLKQHLTITTGLQYLKVDVRARQKNDSLNSLYPGIFNNIQIPLLLGYTTGNQRFSVTVNAGAIFSLYAEAKGRLKDYGWPNHNGITSYLGFNFATRVNNRISLFAEPYIKTWYPQKFQNLPPHLFSTGISVGLRFDLK
jgi:hypothetical protein